MRATVESRLWDYNSATDMADMARDALAQWRDSPAGLARERKAGQRLAFAVSRLDSLGALPRADNGYSVKLDSD